MSELDPATATPPLPDPWGETVARFLGDLLDDTEVQVHTDLVGGPDPDLQPPDARPGPDGRTRQFSFDAARSPAPGSRRALPTELADLPAAALRGLERAVAGTTPRYPSVERALHDVIVAEVVADRLIRRSTPHADLDTLVMTVADTLEYLTRLSVTRLEGEPVTHGVVIAGDLRGNEALHPPVPYPGRLPSRKRTPLLFDGTLAALVIDSSGHVVRSIERTALPTVGADPSMLDRFEELPGLDGSLTAAASAAFDGIGVYLRSDHSTWIFDRGALLFVRRGMTWKSIAFESFTRTLTRLGGTDDHIGRRLARAALRLSLQSQGAILAVADDPDLLESVTEPKDRTGPATSAGTVDDDLQRLLQLDAITTSSGLARLARVDGATVVDRAGGVVAYGAVVRVRESVGEGARSAAARALSKVTAVSISISHDGPITVYHQGKAVLDLL